MQFSLICQKESKTVGSDSPLIPFPLIFNAILLDFFSEFGVLGSSFSCWVSHMDPEIALTELDLRKLKKEVMYSLLPLGSFILSTLYALCRLGVFTICNPLRCLPRTLDKAKLTPRQLFRYKKALMVKKAVNKQSKQPNQKPAAEARTLRLRDTVIGQKIGEQNEELQGGGEEICGKNQRKGSRRRNLRPRSESIHENDGEDYDIQVLEEFTDPLTQLETDQSDVTRSTRIM